MQFTQRLADAVPVGLGLGRSTVDVSHHHQTVGEEAAVHGRDRHGHGQAFTVEMLEQLDLPSEICVASRTEAADRKLPSDPYAPDIIGNAAGEAFDASRIGPPER